MTLQEIAIERLKAGDVKGAEELMAILKKVQWKPEPVPREVAPKRPQVTCLQCGGIWQPRTDHPSFCPKCLSRKWNVEKVSIPTWERVCERCDYEWVSKRFRPAVCPSCKSGKWYLWKGPADGPERVLWSMYYRSVTKEQWAEMVSSGRVEQEITRRKV